ncbi:MAG: 16S rRNA (cytosine(967)-C(5))-methyltransferase RsmB [Lachnospiraceae bacterium]|nr:16S rRNA (cytosine(967)-C(5))-methyltransferase RsmB [Lachnospiraceae bacterium]
MKETCKVNSRELVLSMLMEIDGQKEFSHILLRQVLDKYDYLPGNEKAFIKRLTEGTLERRLELDYILNQYSRVEVHRMKPLIRALLRMSVYQLIYMDNIPDSAVCNEAVKLAVKHKFSSLKGFVNGVLRNIARQKEKLSYPSYEENPLEYLSIRYSMPLWLVEHFVQLYGEELTEQLLQAFLEEHPITIRVKEELSDREREELKDRWQQQKIRVKQHPYLPYAYSCEKLEGVNRMAGFQEGLLGVQDVSSMLVAQSAEIKQGMRILDVCGAPGGKAIHAALKLEGSGQVVARDLSAYKIGLIQKNANRQRVENLIAEVWDATLFDPEKEEWADILFCDLPCSGLGIMGKKRDIKYRLTPESLEELVRLQRKILTVVWPYVKPGGILMYSTCTINPRENEEQVRWITEKFPFEVEPMAEGLPDALRKLETEQGLQLLPGLQETDGFFLARLRRRKSDE